MARDWDETFLKMAALIAQHSTCARTKVGAVLIRDRRVISTGYNGVPTGFLPHCEDLFGRDADGGAHRAWSRAHELHAETNALLWAAKSSAPTEGTTLYVTLPPCRDCAKSIIAAGIKRIVYTGTHHPDEDEATASFMRACAIEVDWR